MRNIWKADIYIQKNSRWFSKHRLKKLGATAHSNGKWTIETSDKSYVTKFCEKNRLRYNWYKKQWDRAGGYRARFLRVNNPPYRCRYCPRRLPVKKLEVDHLVPVARAKKSAFARMLLRIQGIHNVNDGKNLVACCHRCNERKRDRMGIWYVRGHLGKYRLYWLFRNLLRMTFFFGIGYLLIRYRIQFLNLLSVFQ